MGPQASLYPVAPGTLFHETTAALVLTAETFRVWTELLSTGGPHTHTHRGSFFTRSSHVKPAHSHNSCPPERIPLTCLDFGGGDGPLGVSKDGVDGDGVLGACVETLDHVEVKRIPEVYVLYVTV